MSKKALKGLKAGYIFPVKTNTEEAYEVEAAKRLPTLQSLKKEDQKEEYEIPADDEIYDSGSDFKYTDMEVQVAEIGNELEAAMTGGTYTQEGDIYTAKSSDVAPEVALTYAAANVSGGSRLFRHYVCKVMGIEVEHKTKGDGSDIASYKLKLRSTARKIDNAYRDQKDVDKGDNFAWIKSIEKLPLGG